MTSLTPRPIQPPSTGAVLVLPVGPPGAGKSQLGEILSEVSFGRSAVVSPDRYRELMTGDRRNQDCNHEVFNVVDAIVHCRLRHGLPVYLDATNITCLKHYAAMADKVGATVFCVRFCVPEGELRERNKTRLSPVPEDVLETMIRDFNRIPLKSYPGTTITPGEAVEWANRGWIR